MTIRRLLLGLIIITAGILIVLAGAAQDYVAVGLSFGLGLIWLILETNERDFPSSPFFLAFLALAVMNALNNAPTLIVVLGLSADLAAWDLARFRRRIREEAAGAAKTALEMKHLQKLVPVIGGGFLLALIPAYIQISVSFVVVCLVVLLMTLILRQAMLSLRGSASP